MSQVESFKIACARLGDVQKLRGSVEHKAIVEMLDALVASYQAEWINAAPARAAELQIAARQLSKLRHAMMADHETPASPLI
jgi:hypothetical protein